MVEDGPVCFWNTSTSSNERVVGGVDGVAPLVSTKPDAGSDGRVCEPGAGSEGRVCEPDAGSVGGRGCKSSKIMAVWLEINAFKSIICRWSSNMA